MTSPDAIVAPGDAGHSTNAPPVGCPRGCTTWAHCDERVVCEFVHGPDAATEHELQDRGATRERYGAGVCMTGVCVEPCGPTGGCIR